MVMAGARWKVRDGRSIKILNSPWLHDSMNPYINSELHGLNEATISSLRSEDGQQWDVDVVADLFNHRDQQCILHTLLCGNGVSDELYWSEDLNGEYTVRSA